MRVCDEVRPALDRYIDGEADREGREAVERHLEACAECRRELAERRGASALIREWGRTRPASVRGPQIAVRLLMAAAAVLLAAGLTLAHYRGADRDGSHPGTAVASAGHQLVWRTMADGGVEVVPGKAGEPQELVVEAFPLKWRSLSSGVQVIPGQPGGAAELVVDPFPEEGR